ncbi:MAG: hypothetical protein P8M26_10260 [Gammaproteobacteria bacterium]|nr:hypothetical protein [Gammaproteobacteria bacterium]
MGVESDIENPENVNRQMDDKQQETELASEPTASEIAARRAMLAQKVLHHTLPAYAVYA